MGVTTGFVAIAVAMSVGILTLVLRPLWRRPAATIGLVAALSLATLLLYRWVGNPAALDPMLRQAPTTLQDAIAQLEARLRDDPKQTEGWLLLGSAYASAQQSGKARDAYAHAVRLAPNQPDVLVQAAEARALAAPRHRFDPQALAWLQHALQLQPEHQRARWFLGVAQRQAGNPAAAAATWEPLLAQVDPATSKALRAQVDLARNQAGLSPLPASATNFSNAVHVNVELDPQLAARIRLDRNASVFVIARAPGGPPMPVAVEKRSVTELPLSVTLDDSDGPMPARKLSSLRQVEVLARLSISGNAIPQAGDLESQTVRVNLPARQAIVLTISNTQP